MTMETEQSSLDKSSISRRLILKNRWFDHMTISNFLIIPAGIALYMEYLELVPKRVLPSIIAALFFLIYLNKDIVGGKSWTKRKLGLQLIDRKTGENATSFQCFIRNLVIVGLLPLELFSVWRRPAFRLSDRWARTQMIKTEKENAWLIWKDFVQIKEDPKLGLTLLSCLTFSVAIFLMNL
tara:strand:+ start:257 stop:799 length:543 start_codon:yes stop_codon:yes gene_type:complete